MRSCEMGKATYYAVLMTQNCTGKLSLFSLSLSLSSAMSCHRTMTTLAKAAFALQVKNNRRQQQQRGMKVLRIYYYHHILAGYITSLLLYIESVKLTLTSTTNHNSQLN